MLKYSFVPETQRIPPTVLVNHSLPYPNPKPTNTREVIIWQGSELGTTPARGIGNIGSCLGRKMTGEHHRKFFFGVGRASSCDHRALLHPYIKVRLNRMLLPSLFQYGDIFPTEMEYWVEGGVLFLRSSHSQRTNGWRGKIISDS